MKKTVITVTAALFAVIAAPVSAANISALNSNNNIISGTEVSNPVEASTDNAELRGKRYGGLRHKRIAKYKHKGFHGKKFHGRHIGHHKGSKIKHRVHKKHDGHFAHHGVVHHKKFKGKHFKHKSVKRFKY